MWLKLFFLLLYLFLLFAVARFLEAMAWFESGLPGLPSCTSYGCRLLDPVLMSVVQLKALLDKRGLSYDGVVEKSDLTELVNASGQVSQEEVEQSHLEETTDVETNFTSGAHFIEHVEDAKDSVWLVQVSGYQHGRNSHAIGDSRWKNLRRKVAKFGVRMGHLDCSLDVRFCKQKGWHSSFIVLALPSEHQKKARVAIYNFSSNLPIKECALLRWVRDTLDQKVERIEDAEDFFTKWHYIGRKSFLGAEIRAVLFIKAGVTPLFYSALSVKFPGRVKFGIISIDPSSPNFTGWQSVLNSTRINMLPAYVVYTAESNYTYGYRRGEHFSFGCMERFFKTLYPSLNDVFILCFCLANAISLFEPFVSNCSLLKRIKKFTWCIFKYNMVVILVWLPIIAVFQMPYLDQVPLLSLKCIRSLSISEMGQRVRGDYHFYIHHPIFSSIILGVYCVVVGYVCKKYRPSEAEEASDWFNFSQMQSLTHIRPNNLFEPMRAGSHDILSGFGARLYHPSLWLSPSVPSEYIQHLPTWKYCPVPLATRAQANITAIQAVLLSESHHGNSCSDGIAGKDGAFASRARGPDVLASYNEGASNSHAHNHTCASTGNCCINCIQAPDHSVTMSREKSTDESNQHGKLTADFGKKSDKVCFTSGAQVPKQAEHGSSPSLSCELESTKKACMTSKMSNLCKHQSTSSSSSSVASNTSNTNVSQLTITGTVVQHMDSTQSTPYASPCHPTVVVRDAPTDQCQSVGSRNGFPIGYLECHQCVICLEEYVPQTTLCGLPCGHVFHETCIISWLNRDKHFCPMCRWPSYRPRISDHPL